MSLNKQKMVREIGQRTRLKNRDVQAVIETLIEVWTEELVNGGRIELEHFLVLEARTIERSGDQRFPARGFRKIMIRTSKALRERLHATTDKVNSTTPNQPLYLD